MIIERKIIDASFEITKYYKTAKSIEDIEMTFRIIDSDENEIKTIKEKIENISFINQISFCTLFIDENFIIKNSRALDDYEIKNCLFDICNRLKNYKFDITKVNDYKFSIELENKFMRHLNKKEDYFKRVLRNFLENNKVNRNTNYLDCNEIINYYISQRIIKKRKEKLKHLNNL